MAKHLPLLTFLLCAPLLLHSQDLHMTYYQANSPFFNPAGSGNFKGFVKAGGSYRTQYERTYQQGLFHADANFHSPFHPKHWWSTGIQIVYDLAGRLQTGQVGGGIQAAYHLPLGKKSRHILSAGFQINSYHLSVNTSSYLSENTLKGNQDPDLTALNQFNASLISLGAGASYRFVASKKSEVFAGLAVMNFNRPSYRIVRDSTSMGVRLNCQAGYQHQLHKKLTISPAINVSFTERYTTANLQCISEYKLKPRNTWAILSGINHRIGESVALIAGYTSQKLMACIAVDVLSGKAAGTIQNPGAVELSASYIFNRYSRPVVKPIVHCPRL